MIQGTGDAAHTLTIPLTSVPNVCVVEALLTWLSTEQERELSVTWEEPVPQKTRRSSASGAVKKRSQPGKATWGTRLALVFIVVGGLALEALVSAASFQNEQLAEIPPQTYQVSGPPALFITVDAIDHLFLLNNEQNQPAVSVSGWKEARGITSLADIQLQSHQQGDTIFLTWVMKQPISSFLGSEKIDLYIHVPGSTNVHLVTRTGDLTIGYLRGEIQAITQSAHLAIQAELQGHSFVQTTSGQIDFCGSLASGSHDAFQSTSGNIDLTLLANTRFSLSPESSLTRLSNGFSHTLPGTPSDAVLTTTTRTGSIAIQKGHDPGSVWYC